MQYYILEMSQGILCQMIGYTTNPFLIDQIKKVDDLNNYDVRSLECEPDELYILIEREYGIEFNEYDYELRVFPSKDKTCFIISSIAQINIVLGDTDCYSSILSRTASSVLKLLEEVNYTKTDELCNILHYILKKYLFVEMVKKYDLDYNYLCDMSKIDIIKLLARYGYIGTITDYR